MAQERQYADVVLSRMHRLPERAIEYFAEKDYTVDERREHAARGFQLRYQFHHENAETRERVERILTRARKTRAAEAWQQRVFGAFSTYGALWMALAGIYAGMHFGILTPSTTDIGWFLVAFTAPTIVYTLAACRVSGAHSLLFVTLLIGFIGLDLESHCYVRPHTLCRDCALHYGRNRTGRFRLEAAHGERLAGPQEISSLSTEEGGDTSFLEKLGLMAWTDRPATLGLRSVRRSAPTNRILIDYRLLLALSIYQG